MLHTPLERIFSFLNVDFDSLKLEMILEEEFQIVATKAVRCATTDPFK